MRYKPKYKPKPEIGAQRIVSKFLLLPKYLDGEWRWLERAAIFQEYGPNRCSDINSVEWMDMGWKNEKGKLL